MNRLKPAIAKIAGHPKRAAVIWAAIGVLVWFFLATPYLFKAVDCVIETPEKGRIQCLKPIAQNLREDSNIATYATATVAAIIAMQLANRNRHEATRENSSTDQKG